MLRRWWSKTNFLEQIVSVLKSTKSSYHIQNFTRWRSRSSSKASTPVDIGADPIPFRLSHIRVPTASTRHRHQEQQIDLWTTSSTQARPLTKYRLHREKWERNWTWTLQVKFLIQKLGFNLNKSYISRCTTISRTLLMKLTRLRSSGRRDNNKSILMPNIWRDILRASSKRSRDPSVIRTFEQQKFDHNLHEYQIFWLFLQFLLNQFKLDQYLIC